MQGLGTLASAGVPWAQLHGQHTAGQRFYYEVELLTGGLMQIGWADYLFLGNSDNGEG